MEGRQRSLMRQNRATTAAREATRSTDLEENGWDSRYQAGWGLQRLTGEAAEGEIFRNTTGGKSLSDLAHKGQ